MLECRLQGVHLCVVLRLPAGAPPAPPSAYAAFGGADRTPPVASEAAPRRAYREEDYAVAETVLCSNAQHFQDVLVRALSWYR